MAERFGYSKPTGYPSSYNNPSLALPVNLNSGLVAYWKMDEASGTRVDSVNGYNAVVAEGAPAGVAGIISNAVDCSAGNSLAVNSNADLQTGNRDFTIAFWINLDTLQVNVDIMGKEGTFGDFDEFVVFETSPSSSINFIVLNNTTIVGSVLSVGFPGAIPLTAGSWFFVVVWQDVTANTVNITINNNSTVRSATRTGTPTTNAQTLKFGRSFQGPAINGKLDEIGRWNRVLNSAERSYLYNMGAGRTYPF